MIPAIFPFTGKDPIFSESLKELLKAKPDFFKGISPSKEPLRITNTPPEKKSNGWEGFAKKLLTRNLNLSQNPPTYYQDDISYSIDDQRNLSRQHFDLAVKKGLSAMQNSLHEKEDINDMYRHLEAARNYGSDSGLDKSIIQAQERDVFRKLYQAHFDLAKQLYSRFSGNAAGKLMYNQGSVQMEGLAKRAGISEKDLESDFKELNNISVAAARRQFFKMIGDGLKTVTSGQVSGYSQVVDGFRYFWSTF